MEEKPENDAIEDGEDVVDIDDVFEKEVEEEIEEESLRRTTIHSE